MNHSYLFFSHANWKWCSHVPYFTAAYCVLRCVGQCIKLSSHRVQCCCHQSILYLLHTEAKVQILLESPLYYKNYISYFSWITHPVSNYYYSCACLYSLGCDYTYAHLAPGFETSSAKGYLIQYYILLLEWRRKQNQFPKCCSFKKMEWWAISKILVQVNLYICG
jgi:hypothetical protein